MFEIQIQFKQNPPNTQEPRNPHRNPIKMSEKNVLVYALLDQKSVTKENGNMHLERKIHQTKSV